MQDRWVGRVDHLLTPYTLLDLEMSTPYLVLMAPPASSRAGRPRSFVQEAVVDAAALVFRRHGFHGSSLLDLGRAMGLTPGSIYKAFPDKRAIFRAAFERYVSVRRQQLRAKLAAGEDGLSEVEIFLEHYVASATGHEGRDGCLVVNASVEAPFEDDELATRAFESLCDLEDMLVNILDKGQADRSIRVDLDVPATARMIVSLVQGFRVIGKLGRDPDDFLPVSRQVIRLLRCQSE